MLHSKTLPQEQISKRETIVETFSSYRAHLKMSLWTVAAESMLFDTVTEFKMLPLVHLPQPTELRALFAAFCYRYYLQIREK